MPIESLIQPMTPVREVPPSKVVPGCPVCGGCLVPVRGQYRCSRCFFAMCPGCEPVTGYEPVDAGE